MPAFKLLSSSCGEQCFSYLKHFLLPPLPLLYLLYLLFSFQLPKRLSSASHTEAWSGPGVRLNASEIILGGFRLPFSYCRTGLSTLQLFDPSHPLSPTAASYQFLIPSRHSSSSSLPGQDYTGITSSSLPPEISIVSRPHQPLTHHNSLRNSAADQFVFTQYIRAVNVVCWMLMVSYIFLSPHAFLVGPVQGVQGTRLHKEP